MGCGNGRKALSKPNTEGFLFRNESLGRCVCCLEMFLSQKGACGRVRGSPGEKARQGASGSLRLGWRGKQPLGFLVGSLRQNPLSLLILLSYFLLFLERNKMASPFPHKGEGNNSFRLNCFWKVITFKGNGLECASLHNQREFGKSSITWSVSVITGQIGWAGRCTDLSLSCNQKGRISQWQRKGSLRET